MEADVAVAYLYEERGVGHGGGSNHASSGKRVRDAGAGPTDVFQKTLTLHGTIPPRRIATGDAADDGRTTIVPRMYGCSAQRYPYAPGVAKRWVQVSPESSPPESKVRPEAAVTVCASLSSLTKRTVVPAVTVRRAGTKAKFRMWTVGATDPAALSAGAASTAMAANNKLSMPLLCAGRAIGSALRKKNSLRLGVVALPGLQRPERVLDVQ